jgi:hypothetical protein
LLVLAALAVAIAIAVDTRSSAWTRSGSDCERPASQMNRVQPERFSPRRYFASGRAIMSDQTVNVNAAEIWVGVADSADYGATVSAVDR